MSEYLVVSQSRPENFVSVCLGRIEFTAYDLLTVSVHDRCRIAHVKHREPWRRYESLFRAFDCC